MSIPHLGFFIFLCETIITESWAMKFVMLGPMVKNLARSWLGSKKIVAHH
jgi:hypothetical protein